MTNNPSQQRSPDIRKTTASFEGSKALPACPSDKINEDEHGALVEQR